MMIRIACFVGMTLLNLGLLFGQVASVDQAEPQDTFQYQKMLDVIEATILKDHLERFNNNETAYIISSLGYTEEDAPTFSDSVYCLKLAEMDKMSPFSFECNEYVLQTIRYFANKRRKFTGIVLGRSRLYFDLFEETLARHDLPLELKYLSVIESGLRPQVKSRAGALGLWQFMYRTGKLYGLEENSYIDERMDPILSTDAAARYLKKLYEMYDDWNMALAAYNAGPGNVNKAIRRSGGKMTYWEIRPYLPRETQGYVPNFIAMAYMMTHHAAHNIVPIEPLVYEFETDTICLRKSLNTATLDSLFGWTHDEFIQLNPVYKTKHVPETDPPQCIRMPISLIKDWIAHEDTLYQLDSLYFAAPVVETKTEKTNYSASSSSSTTHVVRSGETLSLIASKYGTTVNQIMNTNNLRSTKLKIGQKLVIHGKPTTTKSAPPTSVDSNAKTHTIQSGDNFWNIAKRYGTTAKRLEELNPNLDPTDLKVGQKVRVK
jgi:membrane-bound lytic murein transglycosylase D